MTKTEIYEALAQERNTLIAAHVQLNNAMDQLEKLMQSVQQDIAQELERNP